MLGRESKSRQNGRAKATKRAALAMLMAVTFAATMASQALAAKKPYYTEGTPGAILNGIGQTAYGFFNVVDCGGPVATPTLVMGRSPSYANYQQKIYGIPGLERWNGSRWVLYSWGTWRWSDAPLNAGDYTTFDPATVGVGTGGYYRPIMVFQWYVGSTKIAQANYRFDSNEDYPFWWTNLQNASGGYDAWCSF